MPHRHDKTRKHDQNECSMSSRSLVNAPGTSDNFDSLSSAAIRALGSDDSVAARHCATSELIFTRLCERMAGGRESRTTHLRSDTRPHYSPVLTRCAGRADDGASLCTYCPSVGIVCLVHSEEHKLSAASSKFNLLQECSFSK